MRKVAYTALSILVVLLLVVGGVAVYFRPLLRTGTGYAAHNACAVELLVGRIGESDHDLPDNPLVPVMRTTVDPSKGEARSAIFGVFFPATAYITESGCTLADQAPAFDTVPPVSGGTEWVVDNTGVDAEAVSAALDQAFAESDPEGRERGTRAVVVVHNGVIVGERYAEGFDQRTRQLGWSMGKSVTNALIGRLVLDYGINVNAPVGVNGWNDDDRSAITLDDLLRMRSGLSWDETYALGTPVTEMLYGQSDMGAYTATQPLEHPVGQYVQYSSGTTNLICDVVATETDQHTSQLLRDLVFEPLGMSSAVMERDADSDPVCSSYLWATPRDWARFGQWFLQNGQWEGEQLLPEDWIEYSTTVIPGEGEDEGYGAHWWTNHLSNDELRYPAMPADAYWASGHDGQRVVIVPSANLVVVRLGFTPEIPGDDLGIDILTADLVAAVS